MGFVQDPDSGLLELELLDLSTRRLGECLG